MTIAGTLTGSSISYNRCLFPVAIKHGGTGFANSPPIRIEPMEIVRYIFKATIKKADTAYDPAPTLGGADPTVFVMPTAGHLLAVNLYYSKPILAGTYDMALKINGDTRGSLSFPTVAKQSANHRQATLPFAEKFNADDRLSACLKTSAAFLPLDGDLVCEVTVALGDDRAIHISK